MSFMSFCPTYLTGGDWRCRKEKDRRQTFTKLGQVCWVLRWRHTATSLLPFYFSSLLLLCFFYLLFETLLFFYSLKSWSLDSHCPMSSLVCFIYLFIHMCIHYLSHFSPIPSAHSISPLHPHPCFPAEPVLPFSAILLKRRHKQQ
jgi:hypothetical protein